MYAPMCACQIATSQSDVIKEQGDAQMAKVITWLICIVIVLKNGPLHWICRTIREESFLQEELMTTFLSLCWHIPQLPPRFPNGWWRLSGAKMQSNSNIETNTCSPLLEPETLGSEWELPSQLFLALLALCPGHTDSHIRVHLHNPACDWSQFNEGW